MPSAKHWFLYAVIILLWGSSCRSNVIDFGDGRYEGDFNKEGQRHGEGIYDWNNGDRYEGQFRHGKRHGKGTFVWANGDKFKGDYRNGKRHGRGSYKWTNGASYDGQYAYGKRNGRGTFDAEDGSRYDGWWRDDLKDGHGVLLYADGNRIEGRWSRGELRSDSAVERLPKQPTTEEPDEPTASETIPSPPSPQPETSTAIEVVAVSEEKLPPLPGEPVEPVVAPAPAPEPPEETPSPGVNWKGTQEQAEDYFESREINDDLSALHVKETGEAFEGTITILLENGNKQGQVTVVKGLLHGEEILWGDDGSVLERNRYENGKLLEK